MLICKNCGETAPEGTLTCPACRMAGRLRPAPTSTPVPFVPHARHCRNCASALPAEVEKCPHCQMPSRTTPFSTSTSAAARFDIVHFLN